MSNYWDYDTYNEYFKNRKPIYKQKHCVFILENENGLVKFGISKDFKQRLSAIKSNELIPLTQWYSSEYYSNAKEILDILCRKYDSKKYKGNWFNLNYQEGLNQLITLCNKLGNQNFIQINTQPNEFEKNCFDFFQQFKF